MTMTATEIQFPMVEVSSSGRFGPDCCNNKGGDALVISRDRRIDQGQPFLYLQCDLFFPFEIEVKNTVVTIHVMLCTCKYTERYTC